MSFRVNTPRTVIVASTPTPLPPSQDTQILTNVNSANTFSYPGYNFKGSNMFPANSFDLSGLNYFDAFNNKFQGGVLAPNGNIYFIPTGATYVAIVNPYTRQVDTTSISGLSSLLSKFYGGVVANNGKIYCIPGNSSQILVINTRDNSTYYISGITNANYPTITTDNQKWFGGVLSPNGKIYCIPYFSQCVMIIDPTNDSLDLTSITGINKDNYPNLIDRTSNLESFAGGVLGPNGRIYCIPSDAYGVMVINPENNTIDASSYLYVNAVDISGNPINPPNGIKITNQRFGFFGGALGSDGNVYASPWWFNRILKVDISNTRLSIVNPPFSLSTNQGYWYGTVCSTNGKIYGIPHNSTSILIIDPVTGSTSTIPGITGSDKYQGGVLGPDGIIYCAPRVSSTIMTIKTGIPTQNPWMLAPEFNKF